uniref:Proline rich 12b n=1 Tax=Maylandia zebra TaxID=106582 RepID=A0A3P9D8Q0_9CICH
MERNYPASGFGDLGTGTGWSYERSAKFALVRYVGITEVCILLQGLSGLFDSSLHHASPSGPDPSVMNLISVLDSRPPQPSPSASSLLSQFRTSSWQTAMHTPAPTDLFISGALPGSSSFPSSSALSAYQNPSIFSGRSFTPSLSLQDTTTFSRTSNGLISPHDPLVHIKRSSQSSLGFDHLLSSQSTAFRGSQESATPQTQDPSTSSNCHLSPPHFNLLPSQLHNSSSQLYNASMSSSMAALPPAVLPEPQPLPQTAISRHDSVIKHYPRSSSAHTTTLQSQSYASSGGSSGYHQLVSHYQHSGVSCSPLGKLSLSSDPKTSPQMESQIYQPVIQTAYTSSLSSSSTPSSSSATTKGAKSSSAASQYLSTYGSQSVTKPSTSLPNQTPPQKHIQSYSPNLPPSTHMNVHYDGFNSPHVRDLSTGARSSGGKDFMGVGSGERSFSAEIIAQDSSFVSTSLRKPHTPSTEYGSGSAGSGPSIHSVVGSAVTGNGAAGNEGSSAYHLTESSTSPSTNSTISYSGLHSPVAARPVQSPGGSGANKYFSSIPAPTFMSSPQGFPDNRQARNQLYQSTPPNAKTEATNMLGAEESQDEGNSEDFLIHHLLRPQSSNSHFSQHHPHSEQLSQPILHGESKGMTHDLNKTSEELYQLQSVICTNNITSNSDSGKSLDRSGADMTVTGQERDRGDRHTQQHRLNTHQHPQQTKSDLHDFLSEQDLDLYTPSHLSHLNQPQTHPHTHALQHTQHTHHQLSVTTQITHSHLQQMTIHLATPQQQQSQVTDPETQLSHSQLEQLKQHQFETVSQTDKVGQTQAQLQQCAPLTSICFPDCVFPEMEDLFCSSEYKSSCAGAGHSAQENLSQGHGPTQEDMEALKSGDAAEGYNMVGHQSNQGFGQYCQRLSRTGNGDLHLDHDCLKTHELPSTVNTDQLGLIQSQTPIMGLNSAVQEDSLVNKMIATVGVDENSNSTGVTSPIFCSSRPKKLLRTSSFHLLKQRREPQPQTKKNYAQEYEFWDDEDKADVPADIRLNNRRLPDLLPDLVSSCRKPGGVSGISGLSPQIGDMAFCHPSSYSSLGHPSQPPPHDGPKKRGRKPTKPKREGPPRPRGRPRIRPLPEPPYCRCLMGSAAGENRRGRSRGRGRGRREEGKSLLRTDSLSSSEPVLSEGSVGSAPSLGLSPGPTTTVDYNRNEGNQTKDEMMIHQQRAKEVLDFKPSFMASFLDFLKTGKVQPALEPRHDGGNQETCSSMRGGIKCLSSPSPPLPPTSPQQPPGQFSDGSPGEGPDLTLSSCQSPCKPLDDELKRNLETLPSFSSDEEDSVNKNQDLQKSISSAISALYDTPHSLAAAVASAVVKAQPMLSPPTPQEPSLSPPLKTNSPLIPSMESIKDGASTAATSPPPSTSPPVIPSSPLFNLPFGQSTPPPSTTPPPSSSDQDQEPEAGLPYFSTLSSSPSSLSSHPPSPPTPEEAPQSQRLTSLHLAKKQADAAIAGESEEEDSESGGEGIFRERDEFVVRTEDIGTLKMALQTGREPPPIWRVQKALLQKFSPEIKDGQRQFCATSNYLGYFGDAKVHYQRLYVKFLENVNKKDYVRVCSRKPWHRAGLTLRPKLPPPIKLEKKERELKERQQRKKEKQDREEREQKLREREWGERHRDQKDRQQRDMETDGEPKEKEKAQEKERKENMEQVNRDYTMASKEEKNRGDIKMAFQGRAKTSKDKAEPPPKKRKKWLKAVLSSSSESDYSLLMNSRAMRDMFRSYVEMLVSTALDPDMIQALEDTDDELYLPPMRKIDSMLSEQKKKLLRRVNMSAQHQEALHIFPKMTADPVESGVVKVHLGGEGYNRKTLNQIKRSIPKQQDMKLSIDICRIYSLYHSLHHYKYHTFLHCKKETDNIEQAAEDPGQEEVVQQCMANQGWLESLFSSFMELLTLSAKT